MLIPAEKPYFYIKIITIGEIPGKIIKVHK